MPTISACAGALEGGRGSALVVPRGVKTISSEELRRIGCGGNSEEEFLRIGAERWPC